MAHRRRPTLSPHSLAELSRRLHEDDPAPEPSLGWVYRRVLAALGWSVAALWSLLVIAAPVILVLVIFTPYNWTVEWLTAAAYAIAFSLLVLFVALAESAVTAARARRGWRRVLPFVWLAIGALSCLLAAWFFLDPLPTPKTPFDRIRLMASGAWLGIVVVSVLVWSGVREHDQPPLARWCSIVAGVLYGATTLLASANLAYDLYDRLSWPHGRTIVSALQWSGFAVLYLGRFAAERPHRAPQRWTRIVFAAVVGAAILFGLLWLWSLGMGRR